MKKKNNYKIIDNFLDDETFKEFQKQIFDTNNTPWFYRSDILYKLEDKNDTGYFSLCFFNNFKQDYVLLDQYLYKIYQKLNCKAIIQSRANLFLKKQNKTKLFFHKDYDYKNSYTAVFYLNTNNGGTVLNIENKQIKINSVENRILIFNTDTMHAADIQTDEKIRIIININYF
jgi:hypothetical protein